MIKGKTEHPFNVVVIGAGTAGLVTAAGTAGLGGRVALIERNKMGGDCLNFGCVPSKALISSARLIRQIRDAEKWGLDRQEPQFAFERIFDRMRARRAQIAPNDSQERFESLGVDVFRGEARFISPYEVELDGYKLRVTNFVIATGSRATIPNIQGIDAVPYFTNETIFDELKTRPNHEQENHHHEPRPRFHGKCDDCDSGRRRELVWAAGFDNARFSWIAFRNRPHDGQCQSPDGERDCFFLARDVALCSNRGRVNLLALDSSLLSS